MTGFRKFRKFAAAAVLALLLPAIALQIAFAADPELLGYAALLDEPEVAQRLQLSDEQKEQAATLLNERRNVTVKAALEMRNLSEKEQYAKLAPLIAESEKLARDLLDDQQKAEFDRIRIGREGPVALAEPTMAAQFALTEEQRSQIENLVAERTAAVAEAEAPQAKAVEATFDQRLLAVLSDEQRQAWTDYARVAQAAGVDPADDVAGAAVPADDAAPSAVPAADAVPSPPPAVAGAEMPAPGTTRSGSVPLPRIPQPGETGGDVVGAGDVQQRLENVRLRLSFSDTPWGSVIEWLARQAQLSLIMDAPPEGTLDYSSPEEKTLGQTLDFFNQLLQTKGYRLLLKDRLLILVNLADPIPPTLIDTVAPEDLESRGRYELLRTTFKVRSLPVEEAAQAVGALVAPDGTYIALPSGQIVVTATGSKLLDVRQYIEDAEGTGGGFVSVTLENRIADELMPTIRTLFGIADDAWATPDDSLRIAIDPTGTRFLVSGSPRSIERFQSFVKAIDVADGVAAGAAGADAPYFDTYPAGSEPQLAFQVMQTMLAGIPDVRIALNEGNGTIVLLGRPAQHQTVKEALGVMSKDARQVEVIRLRYVDPSQALQAINLLFGNPTPAAAPAAPGAPAAAAPAASASAPIVAADTLTGMLFIRGSQSQIDQIKDLLTKMGELESDDPYASDRGNIRYIPTLTGPAGHKAVGLAQSIWPTVSENRIRVVTPSELGNDRTLNGLIEERRAPSNGNATGSSNAEGAAPAAPGAVGADNPLGLSQEQLLELEALGVDPSIFLDSANFPNPNAAPLPVEPLPGGAMPRDPRSFVPPPGIPRPAPRPAPAPLPTDPRSEEPDASIQVPAEDREASTSRPQGVTAQFVSLQEGEEPTEADAQPSNDQEPGPGSEVDPSTEPASDVPADDAANPAETQPADDGPPGDIIVSVTPSGTVIASKDTRALDEIETFLNSIASSPNALGPQYTIFYLKHETAGAAKQLLEQALTGETDSGDGGGGLLGDIASSAMADVGGGLLGGILGDSGTSTASGEFVIVANDRLNALFVQANPADLQLIEDLLTIIDREKSPEDVLTKGTAKVVKLANLKAPAVSEIVKATYADRMEQQAGQGGQGGRGGGGPSPEDFIRAIAGGGGRGGRGGQGGGGGTAPEPAKMTVSADEASNSVIIRAPEPLLGEVVQFVKDLDSGAQAETSETMQVLTLKNLSSSSIQASLESILGEQATISSSGPAADGDNGVGGQSRQGSSSSGGDSNRTSSNNNNNDEDARRRAFFDALRNSGVGGRPGSGGGPPQGGPGGGPGGGFRFPGGGGRGGR